MFRMQRLYRKVSYTTLHLSSTLFMTHDYYCATLDSLVHSESDFSVIAQQYWNAIPYDTRCMKYLSILNVNYPCIN